MNKRTMRRIVVSGGNSGIGKALCTQLAAEDDCYVYLGSRSVEKGEAALAEIVKTTPAAAGKIEVVQLDVCDKASITAAAAAVQASLGDEKLYGLVNNAGGGGETGSGEGTIELRR